MLSSCSQLAHPQNLSNVQQICPALNETFVLLCKRSQRSGCLSMRFSVLLHVDKNNSLIKRYNLDFLIDNFTMISPQQIVTPMGNHFQFFIIHLAQKIIQKFPKKTGFNRRRIFSFPETNLICIQQRKADWSEPWKKNQRQGKISYFHKDDLKKAKLQYKFNDQLKEGSLYTDLFIEPGNCHYLVYLRKYPLRGESFLNILLHDVVKSQGNLSSRVREITIPTQQALAQKNCKLWEIRKDTLAVVLMSNVFLYDLNNSTSRMLQLDLVKSSALYTEAIFLKNFILLHQKQEDLLGKKRRSLCFIGVQSEQLEFSHQEKEEREKMLIDVRADPFDPEFFLEAQLELGSRMLHIKRTSVFLLRQRYMMFLLHLNEDFDDDLLLDSLDALDCL